MGLSKGNGEPERGPITDVIRFLLGGFERSPSGRRFRMGDLGFRASGWDPSAGP